MILRGGVSLFPYYDLGGGCANFLMKIALSIGCREPFFS